MRLPRDVTRRATRPDPLTTAHLTSKQKPQTQRVTPTVSLKTTTSPLRPATTRVFGIAGSALLLAASLAACSSSSSSTDTAAPAAGSTQAAGGGNGSGGNGSGGNGQGRVPGANGLVAAVNGSTMQVQGASDQTAVTWTSSTTFAQYVKASLSDVSVGSCVVVTAPASTGTATGGQEAAGTTAVTAGTVRVRTATDGECAGGFGGGAGGRGGQPPSGGGTASTGGTGQGNAGQGGFGSFARGAVGKVTAVKDGVITVSETRRGAGGGAGATGSASSPGSSSSAGSVMQATTVTVTTTATTTYEKEATATSADVKVGACASAQGKTDDTGALAATSVTLSPAVGGKCTTGFGGGRQGRTGTSTGTATNG